MDTPTQSPILATAWWTRVTASRWTHMVSLLILVGGLALTAIHPLMLGRMPVTDDGLTHLNRLITFDHSVRYGQLWPRYVAAMAFGYGAPSFNFYSPVSLYPAEILHLLGMSFLNALLLNLILYVLIGGLGAYVLGIGVV